jgi:GNAT superfamily N-acetyltransferase
MELINRLQQVRANIPTCYVAVTIDNTPAYMQWLMGSEQNESIQMFFNKTFPILEPDEALLENALTLAEFRGKGLMSAAMARIAERGIEVGARWVITFVGEDNIASLKGCKRAGFYPYMLRAERWFLFRRTLTFALLPDGTPYPFDVLPEPTAASADARP